MHTKIILVISIGIMFLGTIIIFLGEKEVIAGNFFNKTMISAFQAISASTTDGFNTIDIGKIMLPPERTGQLVKEW